MSAHPSASTGVPTSAAISAAHERKDDAKDVTKTQEQKWIGKDWRHLLESVTHWYSRGDLVSQKDALVSADIPMAKIEIDPTGTAEAALTLDACEDKTGAKTKVVLLFLFQTCCRSCHMWAKIMSDVHAMLEQIERSRAATMLAVQTSFEHHEVNTHDNAQAIQSALDLPFPVGHDEILDWDALLAAELAAPGSGPAPEPAATSVDNPQSTLSDDSVMTEAIRDKRLTLGRKSKLFVKSHATGSPWLIVLEVSEHTNLVTQVLQAGYPTDPQSTLKLVASYFGATIDFSDWNASPPSP